MYKTYIINNEIKKFMSVKNVLKNKIFVNR